MGWNDFRLAAVGTKYDNEDGSRRQDELRRCQPGEPVALVRQPGNPHDPRAVAIVSARGVCIGFLSRDHAGWVGSKIDRGYDVRAVVQRVKGAHLDGAELGLVILVNMEGDAPELHGEIDQPYNPSGAIAA